METDLDRYRTTFLAEAADHLVALEGALLRLETTNDDAAADDAFRVAHSLKGGADAVGFPRLAKFTHALEELLDRCRNGQPISRPRLDLLLEAQDALAQLVRAARTGAAEPPEVDRLVARFGEDLHAPHQPRGHAPDRFSESFGTAPAAHESGPTAYVVSVVPHADVFRSGLDPLALLRELTQMGTVTRVALNTAGVPPLADLDPERCYLSWTVHLETTHAPEEIADVFAFARDMIRATIDPAPAATVPAPTGAAPAPRLGPSHSMFESVVRKQSVPNPVRFAAFLVQRRALTADRALDALDRHQAERPALSRLAIDTGCLTVSRVFKIISTLHDGDQFATKAVEFGDLTEVDLGRLLLLQEQCTKPLHDWLVSDGVLPRAKIDAELAAFRADDKPAPCAEAPRSQVVSAPVSVPLPPSTTIFRDNGAMMTDFCAEAAEHLEAADRNLLVIDTTPTNTEALNAIYRGFHTIKGVASMLGLAAIQTLAHEAENLLNLARDGKLVLRDKALDLVFASTDALKRQLDTIRHWTPGRGRIESDPALPTLLADLRAVASGKPVAAEKPVASGKPVAAEKPLAAEPPATAKPAAPEEPAPTVESADAQPGTRRGATNDKETVRVDKERLDKLINTIGEMVIAQSMAQQEFNELSAGKVASRALPELSKISRDLQELSLGLRMVPLQTTFQKMTRLVRDLSRKLGKPVTLALHGEETELDKTVVDQLGDPLMHMVRNSLDHGLEDPAERAATGKPAEGRISLRAYYQGGNVYIELNDDGRGLDRARILRKAIEKGIVSEGQRLTDAEVYALIFAPGFSTAAVVTDVSGRGVGMDVVRRNVEALQGNILIRTQLGQGTTFTIRLPLTLAIMDGLMVGLGEDVYVLPILSVIESFRPRAAEIHTVAGRGEVITVRGEVAPLLRLHTILGRPATVTDPRHGLVVLVEDQGKKYALLVDQLLGQMQAVVKSLDANYRRVEGLAGATILGDGRVAMILDIHGLTQLHTQFGGCGPTPVFAAGSEISLGELT